MTLYTGPPKTSMATIKLIDRLKYVAYWQCRILSLIYIYVRNSGGIVLSMYVNDIIRTVTIPVSLRVRICELPHGHPSH